VAIPHGRQDLAVMMLVQPSDNFVDNIVCAVSVDFLSNTICRQYDPANDMLKFLQHLVRQWNVFPFPKSRNAVTE